MMHILQDDSPQVEFYAFNQNIIFILGIKSKLTETTLDSLLVKTLVYCIWKF